MSDLNSHVNYVYFQNSKSIKSTSMKKQITLLILILLLGTAQSWADNGSVFNYGPQGKNYFEKSSKQILVKFQNNLSFEEKAQIISQEKGLEALDKSNVLPAPELAIVKLKAISQSEVDDILSRLQQNSKVVYANQFLKYTDGTLQGIQDRILVRLKSPKDFEALLENTRKFNASIIKQNEFDKLLYEIQTSKQSPGNALEIANKLSETKLFEYAEPDFLLLLKRFSTNDPFLNYQWSLNNTGSSLQYSGTSGADMNVYNAWTISTGSSTIKVAVVDEGVDLNHPDLQANILPGYDATGQGSNGGPSGNDSHGTACAGIIAAAGNNNTGITGVAYNCKIIPIRIAYTNTSGSWVTSNTWIGNALNWAYQTGNADILSNSWGGGSSSATINNAITGAVTNGRGGLGAPVLFAAGNDNGANSYPATEVNTISVIAMSMCYQRKNPSSCDGETWWGSNFGAGADIAAPGVKIYTTDISGSSGYSTGNYTPTFNGTSSATPNAAGVMALILSANPNLTAAQARAAIESTCRKVGGYAYNSNVSGQPNGTWSNDLGYGLVNAYDAMLAVTPQVQNDAGISTILSPIGSVCSTTISPSVTLKNFGSNTLTSVNIEYQIDGGSTQTYNWAGFLASTASTTVNLPSQTLGSGNHTFSSNTSNPNGNSDNVPANNGSNSSFSIATNALTLTIVLDNYPEESSWAIIDGNSNVVASGGTYGSFADGATVTESACIGDGCFDFVFYDAYGDGICCSYGSGSFSLTRDSDGSTLASGGQFASSQTTNFCVQPTSNLSVTTENSGNVSCFGGSNGTATALANGGVPPYSYSWSNGSNGANISNLSAGNYTVTVTDANGNQAIAEVTISQASALSAQINAFNTSCFAGSDGNAIVNVSGGTSPYAYLWSNGASSNSITGLSSGNINVNVYDANGCSVSANSTISSPSLVVINTTSENTNCAGSSNGSASASVLGGTAPYNYSWSNGSSSSTASNLSAGNYTVNITDANGCNASSSVSIDSPVALNVNVSAMNTSCSAASDGSASASVSGGTQPYSYSWSNGATTLSISDVIAGLYTVNVTDNSGCAQSANVTVGSIVSNLSVNVSLSNNVSCFGDNDGAVSCIASGGFSPYSYQWSNGASGQSILGLSAGNYSVEVTDANGCSANSSSVSVNEAAQIVLSTTITNANCNISNGSVALSIVGGIQPYSFSWNNGATSQNTNNLSAGDYSVSITDANGCSANADASVAVVSAVSISISSTDVTCFGSADGTINVQVTGGVAPYSYSWSNGANSQNLSNVGPGNYSVDVIDASACASSVSASIAEPSRIISSSTSSRTCIDQASQNDAQSGSINLTVSGGSSPYSFMWNTGSSSEDLNSISAGDYSLAITDANGCVQNASTTVVLSALSAASSSSSVTCNGANDGAISLSVTSEFASTVSYAWSNGASTQNISGLSGGDYSATITDQFGCVYVTPIELINEPAAISINLSSTDESCANNDGAISSNVSGGIGQYTYSWSNGSNAQNLNGISAGNYTLNVIDANSCNASASAEVKIDCNAGCSYITFASNDFESDFGIWNSGGSDGYLSSIAAYASSGSNSLELRDNTSTSVFTTNDLNMLGVSEITVSFSYYPRSMDNSSEDFWLQLSTDGGASFNTIEEWNFGDEFVNNQRYYDTVVFAGTFSGNTQLRFRCDASGNSDWVNIDDVTISGCKGEVVPTCFDGVQNGDETGVDCGASSCAPCSQGCISQTINSNDFESNWGIWTDGGTDCALVNNAVYANSGSRTIRLRDNSGVGSSTTTSAMNLIGYSEATIEFSYYTESMEEGEDFWLQVSSDGVNFTNVSTYVSNGNFINNTRYNEQVVIPGPFNSGTYFRFRCDASDNSDAVYLDDIFIRGCFGGTPRLEAPQQAEIASSNVSVIKLFPNPSNGLLNIELRLDKMADVQIAVMDISGKIIHMQNFQRIEETMRAQISTQNLASGMYLISFISDTEMVTKRFVVQH
jgi:subtilisin family serine protease